jgi:hypothetical protein
LLAVFAIIRHSTQTQGSRFGTWSGFGWNQLPQNLPRPAAFIFHQ